MKDNMIARLDDWIDRYWDPDEPRPALLKQVRLDVLNKIKLHDQEKEDQEPTRTPP